MAQYTLSLGVVVLSGLVSALAGRWDQGGGRPGFVQISSSDRKCSAVEAVLHDPKSGCCGKHAEAEGEHPDDNGYEPGGDGDYDYGPGGDNDNGYGPVDNDNSDEPGIDNDDDNDSDFDNDFDNDGNNEDWDSDDEWEVGGNGIGDFDFGHSLFTEENRYKRSADKNNSDVAPDKYIIAGKPAGLSQFPWLIHLTVRLQDKMIGCGGSLISSRHVVTAAHCVDFQIADYQDVSVYLSEYNTMTYPNDCLGRECVKNMVVHPNKITQHPRYNRHALHHDIAMMRLSRDAPYTDYIRPICLPQININTAKYEGTPLTVTGWGQTENKQPSAVKLYAQVAQVPPNKCKWHYPDITGGQICAAGKSGQDTCIGDSGGPIMMERDGTFFLAGLVSGKRSDTDCGSSVPTMYTNVYAYTKWIQDFMRN